LAATSRGIFMPLQNNQKIQTLMISKPLRIKKKPALVAGFATGSPTDLLFHLQVSDQTKLLDHHHHAIISEVSKFLDNR
jgi:hypothetical protein